ncbi:MAG: Alpha,alpha-trehalose-phosphate synthase (UDP-forming) [Candidatus Daviesbacteria bacterium GW2011_GWF2_38_7]|nr:MAG: Alpha,alpha-trehalose-phosphate synthase (UDP-forming) [Candidatus Daviesbacteria bacterium GW2011_GWF2_38_7]
MTKLLASNIISQLDLEYLNAKHAIIFLDYDGTLVPFASTPDKAIPDEYIINLLKELIRKQNLEVVLVSGRDKTIMEKWFGSLSIGLIAEHGAWLKNVNGKWQTLTSINAGWKNQALSITKSIADTLSGSIIENKDFSISWHFRLSDQNLVPDKIGALKDSILPLVKSFNLELLQGNFVIEIRNKGINKGKAVKTWLKTKKYDFILSIGDDRTDEDMFAALEATNYTIKVGTGFTKAHYYMQDTEKVRQLLKNIAELPVAK